MVKCPLWIKMASCYYGREECWEFFIFWPAGVGEGLRRVPCVCLSFEHFLRFPKQKMKTEKKSSRPYSSFSNSMKYVARLQSGSWCWSNRDPWTLGSRGRKGWEGLRTFSRAANPSKSNTELTCFIRLQDYSLLPWKAEGGGGGQVGGPDLALPLVFHENPASWTSPRIPLFPASRAKLLANPATRVAVNQVKTFCVSRIPHCISIKSWAPRITSKT